MSRRRTHRTRLRNAGPEVNPVQKTKTKAKTPPGGPKSSKTTANVKKTGSLKK